MSNLRDMQLFLKVAQNGSLSAAGRNVGLSPASVSRRINALEDALGVRLLNRSSRKLTLTEAGDVYLHRLEQILTDIDEAQEAVSQLQSIPRGALRVHSRLLVGMRYIGPALPRFLAAYPEIELDLMMSNFPIDLVGQNVDVDIRIGHLPDSSLIVRKLTSSDRVMVATPGYLQRAPLLTGPDDLADHNCLTYRINLGKHVWRFLDDRSALIEVPVAGNYRSDNGEALLMATLQGLGIGLFPDWAVAEEIADGRLVRLLPTYRISHTDFDNGVYAVYQQIRLRSAKVRVFVDFVAELFRSRRR
jgi:DNA-binding transcriptional LysR family regulator